MTILQNWWFNQEYTFPSFVHSFVTYYEADASRILFPSKGFCVGSYRWTGRTAIGTFCDIQIQYKGSDPSLTMPVHGKLVPTQRHGNQEVTALRAQTNP